jgi:hypothetical protein
MEGGGGGGGKWENGFILELSVGWNLEGVRGPIEYHLGYPFSDIYQLWHFLIEPRTLLHPTKNIDSTLDSLSFFASIKH